MARRRTIASSSVPTPLTDGPIAATLSRLWHPRLTTYQDLCLRLGKLAIELPIDKYHAWYRGPETLYRHSPSYPPGYALMEWVLDVAGQNLLAGVVLMDALDWFCGVLSFVLLDRIPRFPEREHKKEWTERVHEYYVEFEVPAGWVFELRDDIHVAGYRGVALVKRCHLSENWYQGNHGYGRLVGFKGFDLERAIGFDIPCDFSSRLRLEGDTLQVLGQEPLYGYGISIPYAFALRAFRRPWRHEEPLTFVPRPTDDEVLAIAKSSVERLREK